jgi:predicted HTH transcriptional regulator
MNIEKLIQNGESQIVEFKEIPFPENISRVISAFSNTNGGTIVIGVREPNIVVGVQPEQFKQAYQKAIQRVTGDAQIKSEVVDIDGKSIGVICVGKASSIVGSSGGYYARIGLSESALSPQELLLLAAKDVDPKSAISSLIQTVAKQTEEIEKLRMSFDQVNSWKRKFFYAFLGAVAIGMAKILLNLISMAFDYKIL